MRRRDPERKASAPKPSPAKAPPPKPSPAAKPGPDKIREMGGQKERELIGVDLTTLIDTAASIEEGVQLDQWEKEMVSLMMSCLLETITTHLKDCPRCRMQTTFGRPPIKQEDATVKNLALMCETQHPVLANAIAVPIREEIAKLIATMDQRHERIKSGSKDINATRELVQTHTTGRIEGLKVIQGEAGRLAHLEAIKVPLMGEVAAIELARRELLQYFGFPAGQCYFRYRGTTRIPLTDFRKAAVSRVEEIDSQLSATVTQWETRHGMPFELNGTRYLDLEMAERTLRNQQMKQEISPLPVSTSAPPKRTHSRRPSAMSDRTSFSADGPPPSTPHSSSTAASPRAQLPPGLVEAKTSLFEPFRLEELTSDVDIEDAMALDQLDIEDGSPADSTQTRVVVRIRPLIAKEQNMGERSCMGVCADGQTLEFTEATSKQSQIRSLTFHACLDGDMTQQDFFPVSGIKPVLTAVLNGQNGTAFAYGQTGSGKTYTMSGPEMYIGANPADPLDESTGTVPPAVRALCHEICIHQARQQGLMPRCVKAIFKEIKRRMEQDPEGVYTVRACMVEIYNEKIMDLLSAKEDCNIRMNSTQSGFQIEDCQMVHCSHVRELMGAYVNGMHNRTVSATIMNKESSRSHTLLQIFVDYNHQVTGEVRNSKLCLVDLAGSERLKQAHGSEAGARRNMAETSNINRSLLALSNVVSRLSSGETGINYRDSNLTKLLMDSLGGVGSTLLVACVSPASCYIEESGNTLSFASKAANISKKSVVKLTPHELELQRLRDLVSQLRKENEELREGAGGESANLSTDAELQKTIWSKVQALEQAALEWRTHALSLRDLLDQHQVSYAHLAVPGPDTTPTSREHSDSAKRALALRLKEKKAQA